MSRSYEYAPSPSLHSAIICQLGMLLETQSAAATGQLEDMNGTVPEIDTWTTKRQM